MMNVMSSFYSEVENELEPEKAGKMLVQLVFTLQECG